jgi:hypothetical protein
MWGSKCCGSTLCENADPDQDLNFHVDGDSDPDPDWHQKNTDPHADDTSFTHDGIFITRPP